MNIISKKYYLELDTKTFTPYINQKFVCKRNDSILFYITVKADDEILDLTGCKISLVSARCNGSLIEHTIKDYKYCIYRYETVKGEQYAVAVYTIVEIPIVKVQVEFPVYGETKVFNDF